ncbi:MAG: acyl--CoA ligase [Mangrovicoccus sp.]|nr:acyl--CoA ligase [Mangrovicoccus sp.]
MSQMQQMASLAQGIAAAPGPSGPDHPALITPHGQITRSEIAALRPAPALEAGAQVALALGDPLALIRVLAALDGHAGGLLLLSAGLEPDVLAQLIDTASITHVISDREDLGDLPCPVIASGDAVAPGAPPAPSQSTAWMMTTSGTTGIPKIVPHSLASLARSTRRDPLGRAPSWGLILEMTRFAGLQVTLQALLGGGTLVAADRAAPLAEQIGFLARSGVSHLSATSTLWRRLLMAPGIGDLPLRQITLGGEIADQAVLDVLSARFPQARITHIYASTEAGVGFAVNDRQAGFPMSFTETAPGGVGVKIKGDLLWLRAPDGRKPRYLGGQAIEIDEEGYVLTGDRVEIREARAYFLGRDSGVVNIGGVKVYPERVERLIASVPGVGLAQVYEKSNPITGALLMATVVPADPDTDQAALKAAIMESCRAQLEREAVPARIRFAESLETNAAGKILRS